MSHNSLDQLEIAFANFLETDKKTAGEIMDALDNLCADTRELKQSVREALAEVSKMVNELTEGFACDTQETK